VIDAAMAQDVACTYHTEEPCTQVEFFVALDLPVLSGGDFAETASAFLRKSAETAAGFDEIRVPGEHSIKRNRTSVTFEVKNDLWNEVRNLAGNE
jgi:L-2-hydroxycarboxylate dehydrogenase (NAD+)